MARRLLAIIVAVGLATAVWVADDGPASYADVVAEANADYAADLGALPSASTAGSLDDARAFFVGAADALERVVGELEGLTPPDGVEAAHRELLERLNGFADLAGQVAVRAAGVSSHDGLVALANDPVVGVGSYAVAAALAAQACGAVQALVGADRPEVDLHCDVLVR